MQHIWGALKRDTGWHILYLRESTHHIGHCAGWPSIVPSHYYYVMHQATYAWTNWYRTTYTHIDPVNTRARIHTKKNVLQILVLLMAVRKF